MEWTIAAFAFPGRSWSWFTDPRKDERLSWPRHHRGELTVCLGLLRDWNHSNQLLRPVTRHRATGNAAGCERRTRDFSGRKPRRWPLRHRDTHVVFKNQIVHKNKREMPQNRSQISVGLIYTILEYSVPLFYRPTMKRAGMQSQYGD